MSKIDLIFLILFFDSSNLEKEFLTTLTTFEQMTNNSWFIEHGKFKRESISENLR